jgi:PhoD-like phosphatase
MEPAAPAGSEGPPRLVLGPLLRFVDESSATVWVETDRPCEVAVLSARERTWSVHGHHYALLVIPDLQPATETPYQVHLDGVRAWPDPDSAFPPSVIRTFRHDETFRLAFGSCRRCGGYDEAGLKSFGADALVALAERMAGTPREQWPDALFLAGAQVYADDPSPELDDRLKGAHARDVSFEVRDEISNFEEYTWLYRETWSPPAVRWLLSTVPTCMLLDDHDLRDDWNTSISWRRHVESKSWWQDRVVGAFASYWVYQHLGNLSPKELVDDDMFSMVRSVAEDEECTGALDDFAWRSDVDPSYARWSFYRDFGTERLGIRLLAIDSRCSRRLDPADRSMLDDEEWQWVVERALTPREGERIDHLMLGTTLPFLLPHGIHHLEGWSEAITSGHAWGRLGSWFGERLRQAVDLEHWAAFRQSFAAMVELLTTVVRAAEPPASVLLLSGDVHCSYTARARLRGVRHPRTALHQLTMSPFRNPMEPPLKAAYKAFGLPPGAWLWHRIARLAHVADVGIDWRVDHGPWFANGVMTLVFSGRTVRVEIDHAEVRDGRQVLVGTHVQQLAG